MLEPRHNQTQGRNEEQLHVMDDGQVILQPARYFRETGQRTYPSR